MTAIILSFFPEFKQFHIEKPMIEIQNYSQKFKQQVANEAYCHTPAGGYPAVAEKYGIEAGLVFDWVAEFYPAPLPPFSFVHVWIGTTEQSEDAFMAYFACAEDYWDNWEDKDQEEPTPEATGCGFCMDLGEAYLYDEDLLYCQYESQSKPVDNIVKDLPLSTDEAGRAILAACIAHGITRANAVFSYADPTQQVQDTERLYNGLRYLGLFKDKK